MASLSKKLRKRLRKESNMNKHRWCKVVGKLEHNGTTFEQLWFVEHFADNCDAFKGSRRNIRGGNRIVESLEAAIEAEASYWRLQEDDWKDLSKEVEEPKTCGGYPSMLRVVGGSAEKIEVARHLGPFIDAIVDAPSADPEAPEEPPETVDEPADEPAEKLAEAG